MRITLPRDSGPAMLSKRPIRRILALSAAVFALAACGADLPDEFESGMVVKKTFTPESTYPVTMPISCGTGCSTTITTMQYVPPSYTITVAWESSSGWRVDEMPVETSTFEDLEPGDVYPRSGPAVPTGGEHR